MLRALQFSTENDDFLLTYFWLTEVFFRVFARQYPVSLVWRALLPGKTVTVLHSALWSNNGGATCYLWSPAWCFLMSLVNCLLWGEEQVTANMRISYIIMTFLRMRIQILELPECWLCINQLVGILYTDETYEPQKPIKCANKVKNFAQFHNRLHIVT